VSLESDLCPPKPFCHLGLQASVLSSVLTVSILEIDKRISSCQNTLSSLHRSHSLRYFYLTNLAMMRCHRYNRLDDERDLNDAILQFTEAIFLRFYRLDKSDANPMEVFYFLAYALFCRSQKFKRQGDVRSCVKYLRYLRDRSFEAFGVPYVVVTQFLVKALALQLELEPDHYTQNIEEMSALCRELFTLDDEDPYLEAVVSSFALAVGDAVSSFGIPSEQVIECLREANTRLPDLHEVNIALSWSLFVRFDGTGPSDDLDEAIATADKVIAFRSCEGSHSPRLSEATSIAAVIAFYRSALYDNPEYLEEAFLRTHNHLKTGPPEDLQYSYFNQILERLEARRFEEFGVTNGPRRAHAKGPEVVDIPSFSHLATSLVESKSDSDTVKSLSMKLKDRIRHQRAVAFIDRIVDIADVPEAIKYCKLLLASLPPADDFALLSAIKLGDALHRMFTHTTNTEYLDASIAVWRDTTKFPASPWKHDAVTKLTRALFFRFLSSNDRKDFDELMRLFPIAANDVFGWIPSRFNISCMWTWMARSSGHPSTSTAYQSAMSLVQDFLSFSPTVEIQHSRLFAVRDGIDKLPLEFASYHVQVGHLTQAIETLERGRGLLWSELRGFRTSTDLLRKLDSYLAEKFARINRDLEALTTSGYPRVSVKDGEVDAGDGMNPFGQFVVKQRNLVKERDRLIFQIQASPGFETFMKAPSFDILRSSAADGPVIIINHCRWRSDIIIILYDRPPSLILTTDDFYDRAIGLRDQLLAARKKGLDSEEYNDALSSVLAVLYNIVGKPVIEKLRELNVPEQSRIWWCPTSVLCSLPLHAMGPIRSDGRTKLYFSDLYIPSYTPTLSALMEAHRPGPRTFDKPSILLVVQPDANMPNALQEMRVIQTVTPSVTTLLRGKAKPTSALEHLRNHQFAHFSCHGKLEKGKPFEASFKLYKGARLTLLDFVRSQLRTAEFAFLSACHTAELTEESIADEGLHLTAAVQYCGFRSVVGTMWEMADIDGPSLVGDFYRSVFSDKRTELPYHERTAEALRDAVRNLRRKRNITLERWVNFVHYGA